MDGWVVKWMRAYAFGVWQRELVKIESRVPML